MLQECQEPAGELTPQLSKQTKKGNLPPICLPLIPTCLHPACHLIAQSPNRDQIGRIF